MNESGPSLLSLRLWINRETRCLNILDRALVRLRLSQELPESEIELNRRLYFCLLAATRELFPEDDIAPSTECNNQPDPDDQARAQREDKRPDFQWIFLDRYEPDPERSSKQFVVECKRLGNPSRADWVLNRNYTNHGIKRFKDPKHAYAKRFASAAMVGYWQSMEAARILEEVNQESLEGGLPELVLLGRWEAGGISRLEHTFERPFPVSPFRLRHLWIDIRIAV